MADTKFGVDYAKRVSNCKKCKEQLPKGKLRMAKIVPNFFHSGDDGDVMKQYYHAKCLFQTFERARATTKVIESPADVQEWGTLEQADKDEILSLINDLSDKRSDKKPKGDASPKKPAATKAPPGVQAKITDVFAASSNRLETKSKTAKTDISKSESDSNDNSRDSGTRSNDEEINGSTLTSPEKEKKAGSDDSWYEFCKLCLRIAANSKYTAKSQVLKEFITKGSNKDKYNGDLYTLFKMLLPGVDQRVYNVKEKQLIKLFSQIFGSDADEMMDHFNSCGEISETVKTFFEKSDKFPPQKRSTLTIFDVDEWLDEMTQYTREDVQQRHLTKIARKCTTHDLSMIIKEIKSDLRINAGSKHIFEALGSNAYEAFQASRDLRDVIARIEAKKDLPAGVSKELSIGITVGTPVLPMLAEACRSVEYAMKKCPNGMYAEIKYDGERVQLHKKGNHYQYFSRSLKPVQDHKIKHFKDWIPKAFPEGGDLILDAEVLMIDTNTGKPLPFGTLGKHKKEAFSDANVCLFVFDCLLYQGKSLMAKSIKSRRKILNEEMKEIKNHVMFSDMEFIQHGDNATLKSMINKAISEGLEGLVLKDVGSVYEPGKRHWLKVKKDYLQQGAMADTADLILLGAYFGTGSKGGMMSVFLMGCYDKNKRCFVTVTKCGNGHDDTTLDRINKELKNNMEKINKDYDRLPSWIRCSRSLVPDFIPKDPKLSPVWEITGAEFSKSENHTADGISIRFPRVTKIRNDKDWEGATSLDELKKLFATSKEKTDFCDEGDSPTKSEGTTSMSPKKPEVSRGHSLNQLLTKWDVGCSGDVETAEEKDEGNKKNTAEEEEEEKVKKSPKIKRKASGTDNAEKTPEKASAPKTDAKPATPSSSARKRKQDAGRDACRYGEKCYQKNPVHKQKFSHPGDSDWESEGEEKNEEPKKKKVARREEKLDLNDGKAKPQSSTKTNSSEVFAGVKAFFGPKLEERDKLVRILNFYGGDEVDEYSLSDTTHVVCALGEKFDEEVPENALRVNGDWIKESVKKKQQEPVNQYKVE